MPFHSMCVKQSTLILWWQGPGCGGKRNLQEYLRSLHNNTSIKNNSIKSMDEVRMAVQKSIQTRIVGMLYSYCFSSNGIRLGVGGHGVIVCSARSFEHAHIAKKWLCTMNLSNKCARKVSLQQEKL